MGRLGISTTLVFVLLRPSDVVPLQHAGVLLCSSLYNVYKIKAVRLCEVESRTSSKRIFAKLRGILRSRVLCVLYLVYLILMQDIESLLRGTKSDSCGTQEVYA